MADYIEPSEVAQERYVTQYFRGIEDHERIPEGSWQDALNMTTDEYPVARVRAKRRYSDYGDQKAMGLGMPVDAAVIDSSIAILYRKGLATYEGEQYLVGASKQIEPMGRYLYTDSGTLIDTINKTTVSTEQTVTVTGQDYAIQPCMRDMLDVTIYDTQPADPVDGMYYCDLDNGALYRYSAAKQEWVAMPADYTKLTFAANTDLRGLKAGDAVEATIENHKSSYMIEAIDTSLAHPKMVLRGIPETWLDPLLGLTIHRRAPKLDFICEHNNRMWGVRYGNNDQDKFVNEIYASAQGDPTNWFLDEGTAADAWTASVGAAGKWTGMAECGEYLCLFKADKIFLLSGSEPSNFRLTAFDGGGVQAGSERSLTEIGGALYYKSDHGVMRLSPYSYPALISEALGEDVWTDGIGATDGRRYYILMRRSEEQRLYVYDTLTGYWMREAPPEHTQIIVRYHNEVMAVTATEGNVFAAFDYDDDAAEAQKPKREDYVSYQDYIAALLVWEGKRVRDVLIGDMSITDLFLQYNISTPAQAKTKLAELVANGYWLKPMYRSELTYVLLRGAERMIEPPVGYTYTEESYIGTEITGTWLTESEPDWYAETGWLGISQPEEKRLRVLQIRVRAGMDTRLRVKIRYQDTAWTEIGNINRGRAGTYRIAYTPARRNDVYRLRIEGTGPMALYEITQTTEDGGDRNVC